MSSLPHHKMWKIVFVYIVILRLYLARAQIVSGNCPYQMTSGWVFQTYYNKRLLGEPLERNVNVTLMECYDRCAVKYGCLSINVIGESTTSEKICEIFNSKADERTTELVPWQHSDYMRIETQSHCLLGSNAVSVDGAWSEWCSVSPCTYPCGRTGVRQQRRSCTNPLPDCRGQACHGIDYRTITCYEGQCIPNDFFRIEESGNYDFVVGQRETELPIEISSNGTVAIVIQRRINGSSDFDRGWSDYRNGFGNITHEFWLGNDLIWLLVAKYNLTWSLRIYVNNGSEWKYANYSEFEIRSRSNNYRLIIGDYEGNAGDLLGNQDGVDFSTSDFGNSSSSSNNSSANTTTTSRGGWWFGSCLDTVNLNGFYLNGSHNETDFHGIVGSTWQGALYSIVETAMKIEMTGCKPTESDEPLPNCGLDVF